MPVSFASYEAKSALRAATLLTLIEFSGFSMN